MNVKELIKQTYEDAKQINALKKQYEENRKKIEQFFDDKKIDELSVKYDGSLGNTQIIVRKIEQARINYFADKLKKKLDKEIFNEISTKQYEITDIKGLMKLLKNAGVSFKDFSKYVSITDVIDKNKIIELYDVGDITGKDLKGCFDATISKSIRITEKKGGTN
jgi:hypothetical protein